MIDLEVLYFDWLLTQLDPDGVTEEVEHICDLLHRCEFTRRVGKDINRAIDGADLRKTFLSDHDAGNYEPHITNHLLMAECTWFEMLVALAQRLDYLYDGGVEYRYMEMVKNMGLGDLVTYHSESEEEDQSIVDEATLLVDESRISKDGRGGMFPLRGVYRHADQRKVEIWEQQAAYFRENLDL